MVQNFSTQSLSLCTSVVTKITVDPVYIYIYIYVYTHARTHARTHPASCVDLWNNIIIWNIYIYIYILFHTFVTLLCAARRSKIIIVTSKGRTLLAMLSYSRFSLFQLYRDITCLHTKRRIFKSANIKRACVYVCVYIYKMDTWIAWHINYTSFSRSFVSNLRFHFTLIWIICLPNFSPTFRDR